MLVSDNPAKEAAEKLQGLIGDQTLLFLSGGSAFKVLEYLEPKGGLTISMIDERFSMDPKINNFSKLEQTDFFDRAIENQVSIIGTRIHKGESLPKAVINFESQIRRWKTEFPKGRVVALLGLGEDGHTAGILPMPESSRLFKDLFLDPEWVASYEAKDYLRFTVTLSFIQEEVDGVVVYVQGENKREALELIQDKSKELHEVPGRIFEKLENVVVCTDQNVVKSD